MEMETEFVNVANSTRHYKKYADDMRFFVSHNFPSANEIMSLLRLFKCFALWS